MTGLQKADRTAGIAGWLAVAAAAFMFLTRRRIQKALAHGGDLEGLEGEKQELLGEVQLLRTRLDEALERLHEAAPDQGISTDAPSDSQGSEPDASTGTQGSDQA